MHMLWLAENALPSGDTLTNPTSDTAFASQAAIIWANPDINSNAGRNFRIKAFGTIAFGASSTLTLKIMIGTTVLVVMTTPASGSALGPLPWTLDSFVQIRSTGTNGTMIGHGSLHIINASPYLDAGQVNTSTEIVNTQTAANLNLTASFGTSSASNSITLAQFTIEELG